MGVKYSAFQVQSLSNQSVNVDRMSQVAVWLTINSIFHSSKNVPPVTRDMLQISKEQATKANVMLLLVSYL